MACSKGNVEITGVKHETQGQAVSPFCAATPAVTDGNLSLGTGESISITLSSSSKNKEWVAMLLFTTVAYSLASTVDIVKDMRDY